LPQSAVKIENFILTSIDQRSGVRNMFPNVAALQKGAQLEGKLDRAARLLTTHWIATSPGFP
jgi:hypothetical protein